MNAKVSVIVPIYNAEKYLKKCLDSIVSQTFEDTEIILIDDGSTDGSGIIADSYSSKTNIKIIHQTNSGVSFSRNAALDICTGEYVMFVDSDDWLDEKAVEKLYFEAESSSADIVYGIVIKEYKDHSATTKVFQSAFRTTSTESIKTLRCAVYNTNLIKTDIKDLKIINSLGGTPFGLIRKEIIDKYNIRFNNSLPLGEDILFWQMYYEYARSIAYIEFPFYHYRVNDNSLSHGFKKNAIKLYNNVLNTHYDFLVDHKADKNLINAFYLRTINYLFKEMDCYFQNSANPKSWLSRYLEYIKILKTEPYNSAIRLSDTKSILKKSKRFLIFLLKIRMNFMFWLSIKLTVMIRHS